MIPAIVIGSIISYFFIGCVLGGYWVAANKGHWIGTYHIDADGEPWALLFFWPVALGFWGSARLGAYLALRVEEAKAKALQEKTKRQLEHTQRIKELKLLEDQLEVELNQRRLGQ